MPLTNAEKQERWRKRNQLVLTAPAAAIVRQLAAMADQNKLYEIARQLAAMADQNKLYEIARRIDEHLAKTRAAFEQRKRQVAAAPSEGVLALLHEVVSLRRKVSALERQAAAANPEQPVAGPREGGRAARAEQGVEGALACGLRRETRHRLYRGSGPPGSAALAAS
jgi:hypothetical protein